MKGDWGKRRKRFSIKVTCLKGTEENEGVNTAFFALEMGDSYDFTTVNKPHFTPGGELLSHCPTTFNMVGGDPPQISNPLWSRFTLPWNAPIKGPLAAHKEIKKQFRLRECTV